MGSPPGAPGGKAAAEIAVEGEVAVVTYENVESGFRVVKLDVPGRHDRVTVVGLFPRVTVGSRVRVRGTTEVNREYGEQLRATSVTELAPTTLGGIERYLGSGLIKGIGGVTAQRVVKQFGLETLKVLEEEPHRLRDVPGLGRARADAIIASWNDQRAIRDVMVFLQAHGASVHLAARILKRYGAKAVSIVSTDPYRLAIDVWGIGFRTADRIASEMGVAKDSPQRMQAALLQALRDATESGHCYLAAEDLTQRAAQLLSSENGAEPPSMQELEMLGDALASVVSSGHVVVEDADALVRVPAGAVPRTALVYESRMHEAEVRLASRLGTLARAEGLVLPGFAAAIDRFERETGTVLADEQRLAVERAARCPLLVVTGGPGVGKHGPGLTLESID
ncbi:MAG TPA: helix-hairpin-helix domain-containing protein, partial [Labilithrix sp.]|nr:helix-hairpin-helix domain-containing protein [Labilithrix sp.]